MGKEQTLEQLRKIIDDTPIDPNMTFGKEDHIIDWETNLEGNSGPMCVDLRVGKPPTDFFHPPKFELDDVLYIN